MIDNSALYVTLAKTLDVLRREIEDMLKAHGLSEPQHNVLCVLQAAHPEPLSCGDIAAGMVSRDPDITRLLDRLERSGYIERRRGSPDRRLVSVNILEPGLGLLERLREPLERVYQRQFGGLNPSEIESLVEGLNRIRSSLEASSMSSPSRLPRGSSLSLSGAG